MENNQTIKITECPRDAMQGIKAFIPTELKIEYLNTLLKVGFDTMDFGSFVSPKAIPQLKDTAKIVKKLDLSNSKTKLLAIVGNRTGAQNAVVFDEITYLGFPFSLSPTFLQLNIKTGIDEALIRIDNIQNLCAQNAKELIVYFSMAFGNPYGEEIASKNVIETIHYLQNLGIGIISLADTMGVGKAENISNLFSRLIPLFPKIEFGLHLHSTPDSWQDKVEAAYHAGCRRFDSVMLGLGGCPMSGKEMVGNLKTEDLVDYLQNNKIQHSLNLKNLKTASKKATEVFNQ